LYIYNMYKNYHYHTKVSSETITILTKEKIRYFYVLKNTLSVKKLHMYIDNKYKFGEKNIKY